MLVEKWILGRPRAGRRGLLISLQPQWSIQFGTRQFCAVQNLGKSCNGYLTKKKAGNGAWYRNTDVVTSSAKNPA